MKVRKLVAAFLMGFFIVAVFSAATPQLVHAQCGLPGGPACPPKKKRPTAVPPSATPTATHSPTSTSTLAPAAQVNPPSSGSPNSLPAGQGLPGRLGILVGLLLIGLLLTGGVLLITRGLSVPKLSLKQKTPEFPVDHVFHIFKENHDAGVEFPDFGQPSDVLIVDQRANGVPEGGNAEDNTQDFGDPAIGRADLMTPGGSLEDIATHSDLGSEPGDQHTPDEPRKRNNPF